MERCHTDYFKPPLKRNLLSSKINYFPLLSFFSYLVIFFKLIILKRQIKFIFKETLKINKIYIKKKYLVKNPTHKKKEVISSAFKYLKKEEEKS